MHAGRCWRSKDELISDILLWTPSHRRAKTGRPARTYIQQLCVDTGYGLEDLPRAMDDKDALSISTGARGVMVIVAGYGHGDTSSNPGPD